MRKKRPLDRQLQPVRDASLVVIASEDQYAVRQYFDFFSSTRIQFRVLATDDGKSAPQYVLDRLATYMEEFQIGPGDTFWIVCDCDHWIDDDHIQNLTLVLQGCRQKDIQVALSNPCFELWLLLHFADFPTEQALDCDEIAKRLKTAAGSYNKRHIDQLPITLERVHDAVRRATSKHPLLAEIPMQLQTGVHQIIQALVTQNIITVRPTAVTSTPRLKKPRKKK